MPDFGPLVDSRWLQEHLSDPDLRVVDVRWYLDGRSGRESYESGHIPGAVFVDVDTELSSPPGRGRHPLPAPEIFTAAMRRAGVGNGTRVVTYDDASGSVAGRLWWLLRHHGHGPAAVLDGGIQTWNGPLSTGEEASPPGDFEPAGPLTGGIVDRDQVAAGSPGRVLLDARLAERYRGEVEPVDARAGHIPGARNLPWRDLVDATGRFRSPEEMRARFAQAGVEDPGAAVVYCGSGITACHLLLAMEAAGLRGSRLYPGSWSDWITVPDAPIE